MFKLATYTLFRLNNGGVVDTMLKIRTASQEEAFERAAEFGAEMPVEIWQGKALIGKTHGKRASADKR